MYIVYRFELPCGGFYTGITRNLNSRIAMHWSERNTNKYKKSIAVKNSTVSNLKEFSSYFSVISCGGEVDCRWKELDIIQNNSDNILQLNTILSDKRYTETEFRDKRRKVLNLKIKEGIAREQRKVKKWELERNKK